VQSNTPILTAAAVVPAAALRRCVLVMTARDATQQALDALRVNIAWWGSLRSILLTTAIIFPLLTIIAVAVSVWRAVLANRLNIHAPDEKWRKSSKAFQVCLHVWVEGGGAAASAAAAATTVVPGCGFQQHSINQHLRW
jgi:hypothetical protein